MGARSRARTRRALCTIAERRSSTPLSFADVQLALPRSVHSTVHYDQNFQSLSKNYDNFFELQDEGKI
jgi:hypothetical protein